jgi:replicative DNA helicase
MEISSNFLSELFALFYKNKDILEASIEHLKFQYFPNEIYKKIFKYIRDFYLLNHKIPTIGVISQAFLTDKDSKEINNILTQINEAQILDVEDAFNTLNNYIVDSMSIEFYNEFYDLYIDNNKDKARLYMREVADKISNFSIRKGNNYYTTVFKDFSERNRQRVINKNKNELVRGKVPFSIDELDDITGGGIELTDTACLLASSGVGKTKFLRWVGLGAARRGFNVLHIQAEGSKEQCLNGYDATWTAIMMSDIKEGAIPEDKYHELEKIVKSINQKKSDIYVHAFEQFNSGSMTDVRNILSDITKYNGEIDLVIVDYLEKLEPGDGHKYSKSIDGEKLRRESIADKMKNLSLEFQTRLVTATQATDIAPEKLNDVKFVMTRHNVSLAKGLPQSFSIFLTANQTNDEYKEGILRMYCDKLRHSDAKQIIKFYQNYKYDRFYSRTKTINELYKK